MNPIQVLAAVVIKDQKILCVQRGTHKYPYLTNKWEFPGGKMEVGESREQTIKREIREELSMEIQPMKHLLSHTGKLPLMHKKGFVKCKDKYESKYLVAIPHKDGLVYASRSCR